MPVFTIKLLLPQEPGEAPATIGEVTRDLNSAINDHGLLGGNFLVASVDNNEPGFWREWTAEARKGGVHA